MTRPLSAEPDDGLLTLRHAIMKLPLEYREPLVLQVLGGFSTEEIARELDAVLDRGADAPVPRAQQAARHLRGRPPAAGCRRTRGAGDELRRRPAADRRRPAGDASRELAAHLEGCPDCGAFQRRDAQLETDLRRALQEPPDHRAAASPGSSPAQWREWALAASVLLAGVCGARRSGCCVRARRWRARSWCTCRGSRRAGLRPSRRAPPASSRC